MIIGLQEDVLDKCKIEKIKNGRKEYVYSLPRICNIRGGYMDNSGAMLLIYMIKPKDENNYAEAPLIHPVILFPTSGSSSSDNGTDYLCDLRYYAEYTQLEMEF